MCLYSVCIPATDTCEQLCPLKAVSPLIHGAISLDPFIRTLKRLTELRSKKFQVTSAPDSVTVLLYLCPVY